MRIAPLLVVLFLFAGCATSPAPDPIAPITGRSPSTAQRARHAAPDAAFAGVGESVVTGSGSEIAFDTADIASFAPNLELSEADIAEPGSDALAPIRREIIYTAELEVEVISAAEATRSVQKLAEQVGGYLQESDSRSITVRVPATQFDASIDRIASLGAVVERSISASDVTEEMLDLGIRLENARKTRDRLVDHLARSQKIADTLKIEAELSRVSETIEEIEGRVRFMRSQIAMSTITVSWIGQTSVQTNPSLGVPFRWIDELGDGLVAGLVEPMTRLPRLLDCPPRFEPPSDFVRYFSSRSLVEALSADGLRIKVRRHENHDRGALSFWKDLARNQLVDSRGLALSEERDLGDDRALIRGTREVGGQNVDYMLVLIRSAKRIYSFEAWGPKPAFDAHATALETSAKSLRR